MAGTSAANSATTGNQTNANSETEKDPRKLEAERQKLEAEATEAQAKAQVAKTNAELEARKATFGPLTASTFASGEVTLGNGAGEAESVLLAAKAVSDAARQIIVAVRKVVYAGDRKPIVIIAGQQGQIFGRLRAFEAQRELVAQAFRNADAAKACADGIAGIIEPVAEKDEKVDRGPQRPEVLTFVDKSLGKILTAVNPVTSAAAGAGVALEFVAKIASYFQSDYKVAATTVAGVDDDLLAVTVAGGLSNCFYPGRWMKPASVADIFALIGDLEADRDAAQQSLGEAKRSAAEAADKDRADIAKAYNDAANVYVAALAAYDSMIAALAAADTDKVPVVLKIAEEKAVCDLVDEESADLLFVRVNKVIGANYTKKSLWRLPWRMPFFVMGGVVSNYMLVDGATGAVKCAGETANHGGYYSVSDVAEAIGSRTD